jgi:hypothetical protein
VSPRDRTFASFAYEKDLKLVSPKLAEDVLSLLKDELVEVRGVRVIFNEDGMFRSPLVKTTPKGFAHLFCLGLSSSDKDRKPQYTHAQYAAAENPRDVFDLPRVPWRYRFADDNPVARDKSTMGVSGSTLH